VSESVLSRIDHQLEELLERLAAIETRLESIENNLEWQQVKNLRNTPKKDL
jgi:hypothetical protein